MKYIFTVLGLAIAIALVGFALGDYIDTGNVKIKLVSVWIVSGDILVQTSPKHSISGLACAVITG